MKSRSAWIAVLAVLAVLVGSVADTRASGGGALASCQTANPGGTPISMNIMLTDVDPSALNIGSVSVDAFFGTTKYGTFTASNVTITANADPVQGACDIFNGTSLGAQIFTAIGLRANVMTFTACSVQGPGSAVPDPCKAPAGTINTPSGWATTVVGNTITGQITGYAGR